MAASSAASWIVYVKHCENKPDKAAAATARAKKAAERCYALTKAQAVAKVAAAADEPKRKPTAQKKQTEPQKPSAKAAKDKSAASNVNAAVWRNHEGWTYKRGRFPVEYHYFSPDGKTFTVEAEALAHERVCCVI